MPIGSGGAAGSGIGATLFESNLAAPAATIDTGANGIAGTARVLVIYMYLRTDEAVSLSQVNITLNNDAGANYDWIRVTGQNATASANNTLATTNLPVDAAGASAAASTFGASSLIIPRYTATAGFHSGVLSYGAPVPVAANMEMTIRGTNYRSTTAITRLALTPNTGGANFVTGSSLLILGF